MKYEIDGSDMVKWQSFLGKIPEKTPVVLANGLNFFGNDAVRSWSQAIADDTGLEPGAVLNLMKVIEATPENLEFNADASAVVTANVEWLRPWEERDKSDFEQDTLVKIVTTGDHRDCEICIEAAANSPYTLREIRTMAEKWAHYVDPSPAAKLDEQTNLLHPRCRCTYQAWTSTRRLPMSFGGKGEIPKALLTARQLGQRVAGELKLTLKVKS